jgi:endoglucanase
MNCPNFKPNGGGFHMRFRFVTAVLGAFVLSAFSGVEAKLTLRGIGTASDRVLSVTLKSDTVNVTEADVSDPSKWLVNGRPADSLHVFATQSDPCDHFVYLRTEKLAEGGRVSVRTPYGDTTFVFRSRRTLCESIKTNQAGYSGLSKKRFAVLAVWLGTGGGRRIEGPLPEYEVFLPSSGRTVLRGRLEDAEFDSSSGDYPCRIDLSAVPEGGPYRIAVKGFGCSLPFGVGGPFSRRTAYIAFRGQYLQRCGCPTAVPGTVIREKACHTVVYDTDGPIGEANVVVKGDEPSFACHGGYHDAGDADRRAYHISNPIIDLMIYEAFPSVFTDCQFDLPGKFDESYNVLGVENGIPDLLDEAEWGTLVWQYLQNGDGSVHFGTETKGYPEPFAAPLDRDLKKYGTVKVDPRATCPAAGLFMHLGRLIRPYKPELAASLFERGERAAAFGAGEMAGPERLYYAIQKYLATGDPDAHAEVKRLYTLADSLRFNIFVTPGYSLNDSKLDNAAYIYSYVVARNVPTDPEITAFFRAAIRAAADSAVVELEKRLYPVGNDPAKGGWGHNVRQPQYACAPMLQWSLTGEQKYLDAASELMDWKLGLNPQGISYVTGLGFRQVHNPHDRESAWTAERGMGPKPGITVFGPGVTGWGSRRARSLPGIQDLPRERRFVDTRDVISFTEFTIFETMAYDAFYTVLAGGGKWDRKDPFVSEGRGRRD